MKKIRLTEKNLQSIIARVIKESKKPLLVEKDVEWWCECGDDEGCYGTIDFQDQSSDCSCCKPLVQDDKVMAPSGPMSSDMTPAGGGKMDMDMGVEMMKEGYKRMRKIRRR